MTRKSLVAAAVQPKINLQRTFLLLLTYLFSCLTAPDLLAELAKPECNSHNLSTLAESSNPELLQVAAIITQLEQAIEKNDTQKLLRIWHPRVRPTKHRLNELLTKLHFSLGKPVDLSLLRSWQVVSDNSTKSIREGITCHHDGVTFIGPI